MLVNLPSESAKYRMRGDRRQSRIRLERSGHSGSADKRGKEARKVIRAAQ